MQLILQIKSCKFLVNLKGATHLTIFLYADRGNQQKSPSVPSAAIAIFAIAMIGVLNRQYLTCQISAIKFAGIRQVCPFLRICMLIAAHRQMSQPIRLGDIKILSHDFQNGGQQRCLEPGNKIGVANCLHI